MMHRNRFRWDGVETRARRAGNVCPRPVPSNQDPHQATGKLARAADSSLLLGDLMRKPDKGLQSSLDRREDSRFVLRNINEHNDFFPHTERGTPA